MGPYRKSGPVAVAGPLVTPRDVLQATCAGMVYRLDPETGEAEIVASLRVPVAAPLTSVGDDVVAVDAGGTVRRFRVA